jgi:hypothetical protein
MSDNPHPTAVYVERKEVHYNRRWSPAFSRRLDVEVRAETAPKPVMDYSVFHGVGRDVEHSTPHMWRYQALAIADKLSIAAWPFQIRSALSAVTIPGSRIGGQNPVRERTQVIQPRQESLSSRAAVYPEPYFAPGYAKIM